MVVRESRAQACIRPHETADRIEPPNPLSPKGLRGRARGRELKSLIVSHLPFKKTLKKIETKEKKVTDNIEKKGVKKKPLTTKKK